MTDKNPHARALGRLGGLTKTPKRAEASRRNGALGGHPRADGLPPQPRTRKVKPPILLTPHPRPDPPRPAPQPEWEF